MTHKIEDIKRLQRHLKALASDLKRQESLSGKDYSGMTPSQVQKNSAAMSWVGMSIDKSMHEAHAAAVDLGIAGPRGDYGPIDYHPSGFHHYRYQPTKPRCRA